MKTIEQLVQSIDAALETLNEEIESLTRARQELAAIAAASTRPAPAPARRSTGRGTRRRAPRRAAKPAPEGKLHELLAATDGLSTAALAEQANSEPAAVLPLLRGMEAEGRVRRTGQRRGTRWHAVASEEEWLAQRAAELAGRSRNA
jgi:hypothetical protein